MNIQIYGKNKCFDTKKAQRYFKERKVKFQFLDLPRYGMSAGELRNIKSAVGGLNKLIDEKSPEYIACFIQYLSTPEAIEEKLLENPGLFKTPIVRNGKKATIGYQPEIWQDWQ
ncbi:MAG: ArsC/Spx/MgsR family protein [Clostridiales bacterium]